MLFDEEISSALLKPSPRIIFRNSFRKVLAEIGSRGGHARAKALTTRQRKAIATKASKAAAKAHSRNGKDPQPTKTDKIRRCRL